MTPAPSSSCPRSSPARWRGRGHSGVQPTSTEWLGVTYPGDLDDVAARIGRLVADGAYPTPLGPAPRCRARAAYVAGRGRRGAHPAARSQARTR